MTELFQIRNRDGQIAHPKQTSGQISYLFDNALFPEGYRIEWYTDGTFNHLVSLDQVRRHSDSMDSKDLSPEERFILRENGNYIDTATAKSVFHTVGSTGLFPSKWPDTWTIWRVSGGFLKGQVTYEQVCKYYCSGDLTHLGVTLDEWERQYSKAALVHESRSCRYIADVFDTVHQREELWHLSDYLVSSVSSGTIWLLKRGWFHELTPAKS